MTGGGVHSQWDRRRATVLGFVALFLAGWYLLQPLARSKANGDFWGALRDFLAVAAIGLLWSIILESLLPVLFGQSPYGIRTRCARR